MTVQLGLDFVPPASPQERQNRAERKMPWDEPGRIDYARQRLADYHRAVLGMDEKAASEADEAIDAVAFAMNGGTALGMACEERRLLPALACPGRARRHRADGRPARPLRRHRGGLPRRRQGHGPLPIGLRCNACRLGAAVHQRHRVSELPLLASPPRHRHGAERQVGDLEQ